MTLWFYHTLVWEISSDTSIQTFACLSRGFSSGWGGGGIGLAELHKACGIWRMLAPFHNPEKSSHGLVVLGPVPRMEFTTRPFYLAQVLHSQRALTWATRWFLYRKLDKELQIAFTTFRCAGYSLCNSVGHASYCGLREWHKVGRCTACTTVCGGWGIHKQAKRRWHSTYHLCLHLIAAPHCLV